MCVPLAVFYTDTLYLYLVFRIAIKYSNDVYRIRDQKKLNYKRRSLEVPTSSRLKTVLF